MTNLSADPHRRFTLDPSLSLPRVASSLPFTFTGADLYALCSDAMLKAITRSARLVDQKVTTINAARGPHGQGKISVAHFFDHFATEQDTQVAVVEEDFTQARTELVPSVSVDELRHYESVRDTFEGAARKPGGEERRQQQQQQEQQQQQPQKPRPRTASSSERVRAKYADLMARKAGRPGTRPPTVNGGGDVVRDFAALRSMRTNSDTREDDDYVVRTDRMSLNGPPSRPPSSKGKGKGKGRDFPSLDGTLGAAEDLYD